MWHLKILHYFKVSKIEQHQQLNDIAEMVENHCLNTLKAPILALFLLVSMLLDFMSENLHNFTNAKNVNLMQIVIVITYICVRIIKWYRKRFIRLVIK